MPQDTITIDDAIKSAMQLHNSGQFQEAYNIYQKLLQLSPDNAQVLYLLGVLLLQTGNKSQAMLLLKKALEKNPGNTDARYLTGIMQREAEEYIAAIDTLQKVIKQKPAHIDARHELGICLQKAGRLPETIEQFKTILELKPDNARAAYNLLNIYLHHCMWSELTEIIPTMDRLNENSINENTKPGEILSSHIARIDEPCANLALARAHSNAIASAAKAMPEFNFATRKKHKEKLTIAYVCNNFNNHPTAHLICRLFEYYDKNSFNVICYSHGAPDDYYYPQIAACCKMVDINNMDDRKAAETIYADEVDILVDLKGHTPQARLGIFAHHPAPVQITYLGFPGSSGADFFDYVITDKIVTPPLEAANYSENFFYMPNCYQINDNQQKIAERTYTRLEMGLPENGFVFSSFNQNYKIDPVMFDVWCRLLHNTPGSVLWLLKSNEIATENLRLEAEKRGIDKNRLVFAAMEPNKQEHLARIKLADLALDTRICGGHTTSSDTLWAGVPVVTMLGRHFASRVCGSLLTAIDMPELISHSLDEYEKLCLSLANNPEKLQEAKEKLAKNRMSTALFNTKYFVQHLENGYRQAWENFVRGEKGVIGG